LLDENFCFCFVRSLQGDDDDEMEFSNPEDGDDMDGEGEMEEMEDEDSWETGGKPKRQKAKRRHATEDRFFSLSEMESFVKSAEAAENGAGPEDDEEEDEIDYFHGEELPIFYNAKRKRKNSLL